MTKVLSFSLAYLAFLPLWILILVKIVSSLLRGQRNLWSEYVGLGVLVIGALIAIAIVEFSRRRNFGGCDSRMWKIVSYKEAKTVTVKFLIENVFPLLCFDCTTAEGLLLTAAYFLIVTSLAVRHRHFLANVYLEWRGYTFYECELSLCECPSESQKKTVVVRGRLPNSIVEVCACRLNNEVLLWEGK